MRELRGVVKVFLKVGLNPLRCAALPRLAGLPLSVPLVEDLFLPLLMVLRLVLDALEHLLEGPYLLHQEVILLLAGSVLVLFAFY